IGRHRRIAVLAFQTPGPGVFVVDRRDDYGASRGRFGVLYWRKEAESAVAIVLGSFHEAWGFSQPWRPDPGKSPSATGLRPGAQGEPSSAVDSGREDAGAGVPEAVPANARIVRPRHGRARRSRGLPGTGRSWPRPARADSRRGAGAEPIRGRSRGSRVSAWGRPGNGAHGVDSRGQRPVGFLSPLP